MGETHCIKKRTRYKASKPGGWTDEEIVSIKKRRP